MLVKSVMLLTAATMMIAGNGGDVSKTGKDIHTSNELATEPESLLLAGIASQYGRGRMEATIRVRQTGKTAYDLPTPLPQADVYFATLDCRDVGAWFEIRRAGMDESGAPYPWESAYATDCAGLTDGGIGYMLFNRHTPMSRRTAEEWLRRVHTGEYKPVIVAEVDYETAVRWDTVGRGQPVELRRLAPLPFAEESPPGATP